MTIGLVARSRGHLLEIVADGHPVVSVRTPPAGRAAHGTLAGIPVVVSTPSIRRPTLLVELADGCCAVAEHVDGEWSLEYGDHAIEWGADEHGFGFAHRYGGDVVRIVWHGTKGTELIATDLEPRTLIAALVAVMIDRHQRAALHLADPAAAPQLALR